MPRSAEARRGICAQWFNIAAMSGCKDVARLRHEIAGELSESEIAAAQRAAWT
jgi:hypothetical protein